MKARRLNINSRLSLQLPCSIAWRLRASDSRSLCLSRLICKRGTAIIHSRLISFAWVSVPGTEWALVNIHYITCLSSNKESRQGWLDPGAASGDVQAEEDLEEREVWEGEGVFLLKFRGQVSEAKDRICEYSKNRDVQNRSDRYELLEQVRIMMNVTGKDPSARPFTRVPEFGGSRAREGRGAGGTSERWRDRKQAVAV